MQKEALIARSESAPAAVAIAKGMGGFLVAWADRATLGIAVVNETGELLNGPTLVQRNDESPRRALANQLQGKTFWPEGHAGDARIGALSLCPMGGGSVAAAVLDTAGKNGVGGVRLMVFTLSGGLAPTSTRRVASVGPFSYGVAVVEDGDHLLVSWHNGEAERSSVMMSRVLKEDLSLVSTEQLSKGRAAAGPTASRTEAGPMVGWFEVLGDETGHGSEVKVRAAGQGKTEGRTFTVARSGYRDPAPFLSPVGDGLGVVYRDERDDDDLPEFYFRPLSKMGEPMGSETRISRADGFRGPVIRQGGDLVFSAAIRSFQRNLLVGLNRFDTKGVKRGGEFQIYADKSDFIRVALAASGRDALLVYAEDKEGKGRVLSSLVRCEGSR